MYYNLRTRKKTAEDVIAMVGNLKEEMRKFEAKHASMETKLAGVTDDLNAKFEVLFKAMNINPITGGFNSNTASPHVSRGKSLRPNSGDTTQQSRSRASSVDRYVYGYGWDRDSGLTKSVTRPRSATRFDKNNNNNRPGSAGSLYGQLQRTGTNSSVGSGSGGGSSRPHSAQRSSRRGSVEIPPPGSPMTSPSLGLATAGNRGRRMSDGREIARIGFF